MTTGQWLLDIYNHDRIRLIPHPCCLVFKLKNSCSCTVSEYQSLKFKRCICFESSLNFLLVRVEEMLGSLHVCQMKKEI